MYVKVIGGGLVNTQYSEENESGQAHPPMSVGGRGLCICEDARDRAYDCPAENQNKIKLRGGPIPDRRTHSHMCVEEACAVIDNLDDPYFFTFLFVLFF